MGPNLATKSGSNGFPTSRHGLILSEDEATAYTELLEAFPPLFHMVPGPFLTKIWGSGFFARFLGQTTRKDPNTLIEQLWCMCIPPIFSWGSSSFQGNPLSVVLQDAHTQDQDH